MDLTGKMLENYERLYDTLYKEPFKYMREEVGCLEEKIRNLVGSDSIGFSTEFPEKQKEELLLFLDLRRNLLDWMFRETEEEIARMNVLNIL